MTPPVFFIILNACDSRQRVLVALDKTLAEADASLHDRVLKPSQRSCFHLVSGIARPALLFLAATAGGCPQRYVVPASASEVTATLVADGRFAFDPPTA